MTVREGRGSEKELDKHKNKLCSFHQRKTRTLSFTLHSLSLSLSLSLIMSSVHLSFVLLFVFAFAYVSSTACNNGAAAAGGTPAAGIVFCDGGQYCLITSGTSGVCTDFSTSPSGFSGCAPPITDGGPGGNDHCYTASPAFANTQGGTTGYKCLSDETDSTLLCTAYMLASSLSGTHFTCADSFNSPGTYDYSQTNRFFCGPFSPDRGVRGDPQFTGFRGQDFQVHGIDGAVYNIITHTHHQLNAKFNFLQSGTCPAPTISGRRVTNCWSHPGSYMTVLGLQQWINERVLQVDITAGSAASGFDSIIVDGKPIQVGTNISIIDEADNTIAVHIRYVDSHLLIINTPLFSYEVDNSDMFVNNAVKPNVPLMKLQSHGLLGQTWSSQVYNGTEIKYIEGRIDDYVVTDKSVFGTDFLYNLFSN